MKKVTSSTRLQHSCSRLDQNGKAHCAADAHDAPDLPSRHFVHQFRWRRRSFENALPSNVSAPSANLSAVPMATKLSRCSASWVACRSCRHPMRSGYGEDVFFDGAPVGSVSVPVRTTGTQLSECREALCVGVLRTTQLRSRVVVDTALVANLRVVPIARTLLQ